VGGGLGVAVVGVWGGGGGGAWVCGGSLFDVFSFSFRVIFPGGGVASDYRYVCVSVCMSVRV